MRHRKSGVKLNRSSSHRLAMFRNMVTSLLKHDRIKTTDVRAKELRRWADHIITLAKRGDLHARRQAMAIVREKAVVHKIFEEANDRFGNINGGYTRIVKIGKRPGDAASVSMIELVSADEKTKKKKKKAAPKKKAAAPKVEAQEPEAAPESDGAPLDKESAEAQPEAQGADTAEAVETQTDDKADATPEADIAAEETAEPIAEDTEKKADKKTE